MERPTTAHHSRSRPQTSDRERGQPEQFDPAHLVVVRNEDDLAHRVRVTVRDRRRHLSMYTWASTVEPGYDDPVYDVADADPTGVQSYEVRIAFAVYDDDRAASTVVWTNQCHGDATLSVTANGGLEASADTC